MALDGLLALVCASAVVTAAPPGSLSSAPGDNGDNAIVTNLAVQTALQLGREHLLHGNYRLAVNVLEDQLPYINGNQFYLRVLQDAYRRYIQELRLGRQDEEAQRYLRRLAMLDRGALLDNTMNGGKMASTPPAAKETPGSSAAGSPKPTFRLKGSDDDDPFHSRRAMEKPAGGAGELVARAEEEFTHRRYREARLLYEQAHQVDQTATESCRERWAYCKLFCVVEQLNASSSSEPSPDLEEEIRLALNLAPRLEYAKNLLTEIQKRRQGNATLEADKHESAPAMRPSQPSADGWSVTESANFRVFSRQPPDWANKAIQVAERTRGLMQQKWFSAANDTWNPKCDLYLHATSQDYSSVTGQHGSPGHSTIRMENGRVVVRRIDLHCDDPNMLSAILPHETTHVVLAGEFGEQLVPRWADEGIAVLTEPREKIDRHLANLARCRQDNQLFRLQDLVQLDDYPKDPRYISAFYAQSVSLVEFLTNERGPQEFTLFVHDGLRYGYEKALQRHYGYQSFTHLEQRWIQYAFRERLV